MKNSKYFCTFFLISAIFFTKYSIAYADTCTYDSLNRLIKITYDSGQFIEYSYDKSGNILSITDHPASPIITELVLAEYSLKIPLNQSFKLLPFATFNNQQYQQITHDISYHSSNSAVASVDASGNITALTEGSSSISIEYANFKILFDVIVVPSTVDTLKTFYNQKIFSALNVLFKNTVAYENCNSYSLETITQARDTYEGERSIALRQLISLQELLTYAESKKFIDKDSQFLITFNNIQDRIFNRDEALYNKELVLLLSRMNDLTISYEHCKCDTVDSIKKARDTYEGERSTLLREIIIFNKNVDYIQSRLSISISKSTIETFENIQNRIFSRDEFLNAKEFELSHLKE